MRQASRAELAVPAMGVTPLVRFTTRYVASEDRLCLLGRSRDEGEEAVTHCVWLTARLLRQLVPQLLKGLAPMQAADPVRQAAVQGFAQQAARAAQPAVPPVELPPATSSARSLEWLATVVSLRRSPQGVELTLARDAGEDAPAVLLALRPALQRQWLNVLYDQWRRAEWPLDIWPAWMAGGGHPPQRTCSVAVH